MRSLRRDVGATAPRAQETDIRAVRMSCFLDGAIERRRLLVEAPPTLPEMLTAFLRTESA